VANDDFKTQNSKLKTQNSKLFLALFPLPYPPVLMLYLYWTLVLVMVVGIIGAIVPGIPGISLIAIAAFIWAFATNFTSGTTALIVAVVVLVLGIGIDFLAGYLGAKQAGASKWGQIGAMIGLVLGLFGFLPTLPFGGPLGPFIGIIFGSAIGAVVGEYLYSKDLMLSFKAALGLMVGSLVGNLIQEVLAIATVAVFLITTWADKGVVRF